MKWLFAISVLIMLAIPVLAQGPVCGSQMLYFQHNESTSPPGYEELINYPSGNAQVDENITIKNTDGPVLIDAYIMPEGSLHDATMLLRGLRTFTTYHYVDSASGTTQINFTAFQRFSNGTEIVFYSQLTDDINSLTPTDYVTYRVSQQDLKLSPSDRLGIKVYGQTTHSAPVKLYFVYQGTTNTSHFMSGFFECPDIHGEPDMGIALPFAFAVLGALIVGLILIRRKQ